VDATDKAVPNERRREKVRDEGKLPQNREKQLIILERKDAESKKLKELVERKNDRREEETKRQNSLKGKSIKESGGEKDKQAEGKPTYGETERRRKKSTHRKKVRKGKT